MNVLNEFQDSVGEVSIFLLIFLPHSNVLCNFDGENDEKKFSKKNEIKARGGPFSE